jgi:recombination protein RecA
MWAKRVGVDVSSLLISQPDNGEQALEIADMLIRSNSVDVIVVDSVAALTPRAEIEGEIGDSQVASQARLMSQAMRKLTAVINKSKTSLVFINQIRMRIGVMFGNPETTPGGKALKFYSSVRIDLRRLTTLKDNAGATGSRIRARVVKNKIAPPFREAEFDLMFDKGISYEADLLDLGSSCNLIQKSGAWLNYGDIRLGQGRENAIQYLAQNRDLCEEIKNKVLAARGLVQT